MRFTLTQLLLWVVLAAIILSLTQVGGCSARSQTISSLSFSPDGKWLAASAYNWRGANVPFKAYVADVCRTIELMNTTELKRVQVHQETLWGNQGPGFSLMRYTSLGFSPDSKTLSITPFGRWGRAPIQTFDLATGKSNTSFQAIGNDIGEFCLSPDGGKMAVRDFDSLSIWSIPELQRVVQTEVYSPMHWYEASIAFSPDGRTLAIGTDGFELWDVETGQLQFRHSEEKDGLRDVCVYYSPAGTHLAVAGWDGRIEICDLKTMKCVRQSDLGNVRGAAFVPDGKSLAVACSAGIVMIDVETGKVTDRRIRSNNIWSVAISPDGKRIATGDSNADVKLWDLTTGECLRFMRMRGKSALPYPIPVAAFLLWLWAWKRQKRSSRPVTEATVK